jgi:hypothetical protein
MEMDITWTQADMEQKLRQELEANGFEVVESAEKKEPEELQLLKGLKGKRRSRKQETFQWTFRPTVSVKVRAKVNPALSTSPVRSAEEAPLSVVQTQPGPEEDEFDAPIDESMLPPGVDIRSLRALEEAAQAERAGKKPQRRRMPGESDERPDK